MALSFLANLFAFLQTSKPSFLKAAENFLLKFSAISMRFFLARNLLFSEDNKRRRKR